MKVQSKTFLFDTLLSNTRYRSCMTFPSVEWVWRRWWNVKVRGGELRFLEGSRGKRGTRCEERREQEKGRRCEERREESHIFRRAKKKEARRREERLKEEKATRHKDWRRKEGDVRKDWTRQMSTAKGFRRKHVLLRSTANSPQVASITRERKKREKEKHITLLAVLAIFRVSCREFPCLLPCLLAFLRSCLPRLALNK